MCTTFTAEHREMCVGQKASTAFGIASSNSIKFLRQKYPTNFTFHFYKIQIVSQLWQQDITSTHVVLERLYYSSWWESKCFNYSIRTSQKRTASATALNLSDLGSNSYTVQIVQQLYARFTSRYQFCIDSLILLVRIQML